MTEETMAQRFSRLPMEYLMTRYQAMCEAAERHSKMATDFARHAKTFDEALALKRQRESE